jgi:hypothetical protein
VLTAESIMAPLVDPAAVTDQQVACVTTLEELIPLVAPTADPLYVMNPEGECIGSVNRASVMMALAANN